MVSGHPFVKSDERELLPLLSCSLKKIDGVKSVGRDSLLGIKDKAIIVF